MTSDNNNTAYSVEEYFANPERYTNLDFSQEIKVNESGEHVIELGEHDRTIAHYVGRYGNKQMLEYVVKTYGEDILYIKDDLNISVLHYVARYGTQEMLVYSMQFDFDFDAKASTGVAVISYAACNEVEFVLDYFVEIASDRGKAVNMHAVDLHKCNAIYHATYYECNEAIKYLASIGVSVNTVSERDENTPVRLVTYTGSAEVLETLIEAGAEINDDIDKTTKTALGNAAYYGHTVVLKILFWNGADVNGFDKDGSILHNAVLSDNFETVQAVIASDMQDSFSELPLYGEDASFMSEEV